MSTTPENFVTLANGAGSAVVHGELVRASANKTFARAQANTLGNSDGYIGVNGSGTIGIGGPAQIFTSGGQLDVLMVSGRC